MNERIRLLAERAGAVFEKTNGLNDCPQDSLVGDEIEKFAELIVRECVKLCEHGPNDDEFDEYDMGMWVKAKSIKTAIKQHFGIE